MSSPIQRNRCPTHPGAILREDVIPALAISESGLSERLGISVEALNEVTAEKAPITPDLAERIGALCGNGPDLWLAMQASYDQWQAEHQS